MLSTTMTIRRAIAAVLRCAALSRRAPVLVAPAPEPVLADDVEGKEPIPGQIPDVVADELPGLEEDLGPVVVPRQDCLPQKDGSYKWWGTHAWQWVGTAYLCQRCGREWPEPPEDPRDE